MTIYIEQSLLENFVIDFLLLKLSLLLFKYKTKNYKLILSSLLGSIAALISPLLNNVLSVTLKLILGIIMVLIISPKISIKKILYLYLSFIGFTFLFGGASYALVNFTKSLQNYTLKNLPFFYILLVCVLLFYFSICLIRKIYERKSTHKFEYIVTLSSEHATVTTNAFLDSGNRLQDNYSPVILIDSLTFLKLYPNESLTNILLKRTNNLSMKNTHILKVNNINNSNSDLIVFTLPKITIDNTLEFSNIACAITLKKFKLETPTSCLLNPLLF